MKNDPEKMAEKKEKLESRQKTLDRILKEKEKNKNKNTDLIKENHELKVNSVDTNDIINENGIENSNSNSQDDEKKNIDEMNINSNENETKESSLRNTDTDSHNNMQMHLRSIDKNDTDVTDTYPSDRTNMHGINDYVYKKISQHCPGCCIC